MAANIEDVREWSITKVKDEQTQFSIKKRRQENGLLTILPLLHIVDHTIKKVLLLGFVFKTCSMSHALSL